MTSVLRSCLNKEVAPVLASPSFAVVAHRAIISILGELEKPGNRLYLLSDKYHY
jgi:hypothetical protein